MKLLIDMNLSPDWVAVFEKQGWQALHWSAVGDPRATDRVIMEWQGPMAMWYLLMILILGLC